MPAVRQAPFQAVCLDHGTAPGSSEGPGRGGLRCLEPWAGTGGTWRKAIKFYILGFLMCNHGNVDLNDYYENQIPLSLNRGSIF